MFKVLRIQRQPDLDSSEFRVFGREVYFYARPVQQWKYFYWTLLGASGKRLFVVQSPWLTIRVTK